MEGDIERRRTGDGVDAHALISLDEHVNRVLEHPRSEQQRRYVVEHDPCMHARRAVRYIERERGEVDEAMKAVPGLGKLGTTRMEEEMALRRGSSTCTPPFF